MKKLFLGICFLNFSSLSPQEFIRAQCFGPRFEMLFSLSDKLKEHGLLLVNSNPDVLFCTVVTKKQLSGSRPIILFEKKGSPSPRAAMIELLKHPKVLGLFKNTTLRDNTLYQADIASNSYHWKLFVDAAGIAHEKMSSGLTPAQSRKIHCMPFNSSSAFSARFNALRRIEVDYDQERPIDVLFAGKLRLEIGKDGELIMFAQHRKAAVNAIRAIKGIKTMVVEGVKPLPFEKYMELTKSAKIVVSPWGNGPWCFRDCEAMSAGAVLVKPDTSFLLCYPDMFKDNKYYVPCSPSFSDLEKVVRTILADYNAYKPMRKAAKELMNSVSRDDFVQKFVAKVREIMAKK